MSAYISFFVRGKDDNFYPIATYSRSTYIYSVFSDWGYAPWEKITPLDRNKLLNVRINLNKLFSDHTLSLTEYEERIAQIVQMTNNSVDEKLEAIENEQSCIKEIKLTMDEIKHAHAFIRFLEDILDSVAYGEDEGLNPEAYLYAGVEVCMPSANDIIKE